ncbi:hypothetical protein [Devosia sp. CAU 1758]
MTAPIELLHKLDIHSGDRLWLINAPQLLAEELSAGAEVEIVHEDDRHNGVLAFFESPAEVVALADRIVADLAEGAVVWVAYRKGPAGRSAGLTSETGWAPFAEAGWQVVQKVVIDDEWAGLRFRPSQP